MPSGLRPSGIASLLCQYLAYGTRGHVITNTYSSMSLYAQHCNTLVVTALYHVYPCTVFVTWVSCILHVDLYFMRLQLALSLGVYVQSSFCNYRTLQFTKVMKNQQFLVINTLHCCTSLQTPGRTPRHGFCINTKCNTTQDVAKHTFLISPYIPLVLSSWRGMQHFNYTHNVECMHNTIEKRVLYVSYVVSGHDLCCIGLISVWLGHI